MGTNVRQTVFDINESTGGDVFFHIIMKEGETLHGLYMNFGVSEVADASGIGLVVSTQPNLPALTVLGVRTGAMITGTGGGLAMRHAVLDVVQEFRVPFVLPFDRESRFVVVHLDFANFAGDLARGYCAFNLEFARPSRRPRQRGES